MKNKFVKKFIAGMMAMSIAASALPGVSATENINYLTGDDSYVVGYGAVIGDEIGSK